MARIFFESLIYYTLVLASIFEFSYSLKLVSFPINFRLTKLSSHPYYRINSYHNPLRRELLSAQSTFLLNSIDSSQNDDDQDPASKNKGMQPIKLVLSTLSIGAVVYFAAAYFKNVDFSLLMTEALSKVSEMGPYGYLYFSAVYIIAEMLAIPVFPLTASSGYLFGYYFSINDIF
jgi:hypothetical protein